MAGWFPESFSGFLFLVVLCIFFSVAVFGPPLFDSRSNRLVNRLERQNPLILTMNDNENELPMMGGMVSSPAFLPASEIAECSTFRDAVCLAWSKRRIKGMTRSRLAELCELHPQHVSDYLAREENHTKGQRRRSLPAEKIAAYECAVGNRAVTQFLVRQVELNLMEEWQAQMGRKAA